MAHVDIAIRLFIAVLLSSAVVLTTPTEARRLSSLAQRDSAGFSDHMTRVAGFRCSVPQPRSVRASDVVSEVIAPEEHIMPPMTLLHRCDGGSGCCDQAEGMTCAPAEDGVETVSIVFRIEALFGKKARFVWAHASNHTACECRNLNAV